MKKLIGTLALATLFVTGVTFAQQQKPEDKKEDKKEIRKDGDHDGKHKGDHKGHGKHKGEMKMRENAENRKEKSEMEKK